MSIRSLFLLSFLFFGSCEKEEVCPCREAKVKGFTYDVRLCDDEVFNRLQEVGTEKEARIMMERSNCR